MVTIISTHPVTVRYIKWERDDVAHSKRAVWDCTIKGGAGVALGKGELVVHEGVATEIDEKALEILETIPSFQDDMKNGYIKVLKGVRAKAVDADAEAEKDMNPNATGKQIKSSELEADGAEINDDGSIDITHGGKNVEARKTVEQSKPQSISIPIPKKGRGRKGK